MGKLSGKIALITGGNSGIGFATAEEFLREDATVIITGRNENAINQAVEKLGNEAKGFVADVSDVKQIETLAQNVKNIFGKVDVLFINAGIFKPSPLGQIDEDSFDEQMNINFKGAVFTLEKFLPLLSEGASVINLSSVNAYTGMANTAIYGASKAAMNSFTRTAATELAPRKIRINAVNPGPVETPIFGKSGLPQELLSEFAEAMQKRIPLKRFGKSEEIAKLVTFLASNDASFITGAEINIDGGININPGPI